jgi:hypothetical protein
MEFVYSTFIYSNPDVMRYRSNTIHPMGWWEAYTPFSSPLPHELKFDYHTSG